MGTINLEEAFERAQRLRGNGKVEEAVLLYQDIATLSLEAKNETQAATALHMAGDAIKMTINHQKQSKFRAASEYFSRAYALFGSVNAKDKQGAVLRDIAIAADKTGNYSLALESFQRSLEILAEVDEPAELAITYDKLGLHFTHTGEPSKALPYMDKAFELLRQAPTHGFYRATTHLDRAVTYFKLRNFEEALKDAETALGWFEADHGGSTYNVRQAQTTALLALIYEQIGNVKQSRHCFERSGRLLKSFDEAVAARIKTEIEDWASSL